MTVEMVVIEGKNITNKEMLWKEVHEKMKLPDYFGNNLDALADVLAEQKEKVQVEILDGQTIEKNLGNYGKAFLKVLERFCIVKKCERFD